MDAATWCAGAPRWSDSSSGDGRRRALEGLFSVLSSSVAVGQAPTSVAGVCTTAVQEAAMYRRTLLIVLLALSLAGCYTDSGYYSSRVTELPTTYGTSVYSYDNGYSSNYYQEQRIYVAPQPRYYSVPQVRYYSPPPVRYYAPPPVPRYYQPGRPPGYGWGDNRYRGNPGYRHPPRNDFRGSPGRPGPSWGDGHGDGRGHGGPGRGGGRGDGRGGRGGDGRGGHR